MNLSAAPPTASPTASTRSQIEAAHARHPTLPIEVVIKEDVLRTGLAFSPAALKMAAQFKAKAYFIFSFDLVPLKDMENHEHWSAPEEIWLEAGAWNFRPTIVSVRLNPASPYMVDVNEDGEAVLKLEGENVADVRFPPVPAYYTRALESGKKVIEIAPTIEWGYLVYLTVFRICQYFGDKEECQFCDINNNYRQQIQEGRPYTGVKSVEEILEALAIIASTDSQSRAYTITGGSITSQLKGESEAVFYAKYAAAIEREFPGRWIGKMVAQALPRDEAQRFKDAGIQIYHPNYEIWDERLFSIICPGKDRYVGRQEWHRRIVAAADIFGPSHVIPNFVAGIEMSKPNGFVEVEDAIRSTGEGLDFFMSHGICPRFTTWCAEPLTTLGKTTPGGAPLEYHLRLLETWRDTHAKYKLPVPPGYGDPGLGRAVFSVSSFMDVVQG
ncbi:MAG TPA: radical SAM protein [Terriglobales bacterium]|nr:radical SAM protein [Terriglobales bacterium]